MALVIYEATDSAGTLTWQTLLHAFPKIAAT
jgi:hypothetical protein